MGRFCLFSSIFQLPFYTLVFSEWGCFFLLVRLGSGGNTKDFLSLPKKVLVTLIHFICSFFSTARRTNQEVPPLLSGFWVRRYGRRRGLRNSLRSDSPRPFSSVFLATSPPDKGGKKYMGKLRCILSSPLGSENKMVCPIWRIRRRVLPLHSNFYSVIRMIQQGKHICFDVRRRGVRALSIVHVHWFSGFI